MIKEALFSKKELFYSLTAEAAAVANLFYLQSFYQLILLLSLHLIACLLMVPLIFPLLFKRYKRYTKRITFVLISICFFMSFPGYLLLLFVFLYLLVSRRKRVSVKIESFSLSEFLAGSVSLKGRAMGEAPLYLLRKSEGLRGKEVDLLAALLLEIKNPRFLSNAAGILSSQYDELRLSVFSTLTRLEKSIQERINLLSERLKGNSPDEEKADILFKLAQNYYDLVYHRLVDEELEKPTLQKAEDYLLQAMDIRQDAEFLILMSKVQMAKGNLSSAERFLMRAGELNGLHPTRYIPYLTEIYFRKGQYSRVVELLPKHAEDLKYSMNPYLAYICEFWIVDDAGPPE
ncbi:MAG: hypothetical protein ABDH29_05825 [Aquificaceae bacterium]